MKTAKAFALLALTSALLLAAGLTAGCSTERQSRSVSRSVGLGGAKSVEAGFEVGAGNLKISGGAGRLMEATFRHRTSGFSSRDASGWEPRVDYRAGGGRGELSVGLPDTGGIVLGSVRNEADVRLNGAVPVALNAEVGSGDGTLDLGGVSLTDLAIGADSGDVEADLGERQPDLGSVQVTTGSGDADLDLSGSHPSLADLEANVDSGDAALDLAGDLRENLEATVVVGSGDVTLRLPEDAGVRVDADVGSGDVKAGGLRREGGAYVNDAYGKSGAKLRISLGVGSGNVNLETVG